MAQWNDRIREHPVRPQLKELAERLGRVDDALDENGAEQLARVRRVVGYAQTLIQASDEDLLSPQLLDTVSNAVANVVTAVTSFEGTPEVGYLEQAASYADAVLSSLAPIPPPPPDKQSRALAEHVKSFRTVADSVVGDLRSTVAAATAEVQILRDAVAEGASTNQAQLADATERVAQMTATIDEQSTRLDAALAGFDVQSTTVLAELQTTVSTTEEARLAEAKAAEEAAVARFEAEAAQARSSFAEHGSSAVARLEELKVQAEELVGVVTSTATAGYFKGVADGEKKTADLLRVVAVGCVVVVVVLGIWIVKSSGGNSDFSWGHLAAKAFLTVPLAALAGYAGTQSGSHRQVERDARHTQLQLSALEPFLLPLEAEEQAKVRAQLAAHLFGPRATAVRDGDDAINVGTLARAIGLALADQALKR